MNQELPPGLETWLLAYIADSLSPNKVEEWVVRTSAAIKREIPDLAIHPDLLPALEQGVRAQWMAFLSALAQDALDFELVEAAARVAHEPGELGVLRLDEHVDAIDVGVARGVDDGLAHRRDERTGRVVERLVADDHRLDPDVMVGLDRHGHRLDGRVERRRLALVRGAVQPRAQLALLAPGDRRALCAGRRSAARCRA